MKYKKAEIFDYVQYLFQVTGFNDHQPDIYSNLIKNSDYMPDYVIDGDRSYQNILNKVHTIGKIKVLLLHRTDNNQSGDFQFPMSKEETISPFILTHKIKPDRYYTILSFCKQNYVTVNDVLLTAYFRTLAEMLNANGKALTISIMVDMRRYLDDKSLYALTNLTSVVGITTIVEPKEEFYKTLSKVKAEMAAKKADDLGLNTFVKLHMVFNVFHQKKAYHILEKTLHNPKICMTNIGVIDSTKLHFENSSIDNVYICGSIKYRPHFQMAVSTYLNKMTFSVNLYGSQMDRNNILQFFRLMDQELNLLN